jgi:hypothetical protein
VPIGVETVRRFIFSILARDSLVERDRAMAETGRALNDFRLIRAHEGSADRDGVERPFETASKSA